MLCSPAFIYRECLVVYFFFLFLFFFSLHEKSPDVIPYNAIYIYNNDSCIILCSPV